MNLKGMVWLCAKEHEGCKPTNIVRHVDLSVSKQSSVGELHESTCFCGQSKNGASKKSSMGAEQKDSDPLTETI